MEYQELIDLGFGNGFNVCKVLTHTEEDYTGRHDTKLQELDLAIYNADLQLTQAFGEVSSLYDRFPETRKEIYFTMNSLLDEVDKYIAKPDMKFKEERQAIANKLRNKIMEQYSEYSTKSKKIKINANQNQIYQIFYQLRTTILKDRDKPILDYSYTQLAQFLIDNVEGFESKNVSQLSKEIIKVPKKGKLKEDIVISVE